MVEELDKKEPEIVDLEHDSSENSLENDNDEVENEEEEEEEQESHSEV